MANQATKTVNGIPMDILENTVESIKKEPKLAKSKFHISNKWVSGGQNQTTITSFYSSGRENFHKRTFTLQSDEPELLAGNDTSPNPVEHLLNALAGCLTSSMVYHAAVNGINIYEVESEVEGDIDLRGFMGLAEDIRKGYNKINVRFRVKSDSENTEQLKSLAKFSPVLDVVSNGTKVDISISS
ncbi:MAG: osmotically inducible protein C [Planctomycetes bacterium GWF2_41_51]|nr:MAG: osmotically inducible protein C [Planctomycetes bacterium GWF2_41_51]HBG28315.1 osmotically inducible protein C [Phycisphaerales bacterium]